MVTTYRDWKTGDVINICASIDEFCGAYSQFIFANDINVTKSPETCSLEFGTERGCGLHLNNVELTFKLVKVSGSVEGKSCNPQQIYRTIGSVRTNYNGVAGLTYTITEQDRLDYQNAQSSGTPYKIMACITNADGQTTIPSQISIVSDNIGVSPGVVVTHTLDIVVKPWSWYTPGGAATDILTKINDINGAILNFFAEYGIIDYQYLNTEVFTGTGEQQGNVIIRLNLRKTGLEGMAWPLAVKAILALIAIGVIIVGIGRIIDWIFGGVDQGLTNKQLADNGQEYMNKQVDDCEAKVCNISGITQDQKVECIKNCRANNLINWKDYNKKNYPDSDQTPLDTGATDIQSCYSTYLASSKTAADYATFLSCSNIKAKDAVSDAKDNILVVYPPDAPAGSKEKPTDWGKILLVGGIVVVGIVVVTRR